MTAVSEKFAPELGFINQWLLCGPFDNLGMHGHDRVYPPETEINLTAEYEGKEGLKVAWKPSRALEWQGYVDLLKEFEQTDWVCAYALCWVTVTGGPKEVMFRVGSNDSVKVFLNGQEIWNNKVERVATADDDLVPVTLPEGISSIVVKIGQTGRNWGLFFRITERNSLEVPTGISVSIQAPHQSAK